MQANLAILQLYMLWNAPPPRRSSKVAPVNREVECLAVIERGLSLFEQVSSTLGQSLLVLFLCHPDIEKLEGAANVKIEGAEGRAFLKEVAIPLFHASNFEAATEYAEAIFENKALPPKQGNVDPITQVMLTVVKTNRTPDFSLKQTSS